MRTYRFFALVCMLIFAAVGLLFLLIPDQVLGLFNSLSAAFGLPESPATGWNFYLILAAGYMYMVTVLAFLMYRHPENKYFAQLLVHAKIASSLLSLAFFFLHAHYLIYLANGMIDGLIGVTALILSRKTGAFPQ
ncbi:MAG: hypothetical protein PHE50_07870 [Dehalococcoidales bacterium]|nr:hypothetical protein [Dehalococcoidales bacterium]